MSFDSRSLAVRSTASDGAKHFVVEGTEEIADTGRVYPTGAGGDIANGRFEETDEVAGTGSGEHAAEFEAEEGIEHSLDAVAVTGIDMVEFDGAWRAGALGTALGGRGFAALAPGLAEGGGVAWVVVGAEGCACARPASAGLTVATEGDAAVGRAEGWRGWRDGRKTRIVG